MIAFYLNNLGIPGYTNHLPTLSVLDFYFPYILFFPCVAFSNIKRYTRTDRVQNSFRARLATLLWVYRGRTRPNYWESKGNMAELEEILQKLLVPDNTVIQQVNDSLTVHPSITLLFMETHVGVI